MNTSKWMAKIRHGWRWILRREETDRELDEEFQYHLERQMEADRARGLSAEEIELAARRAWLGADARKEECRDARGVNWLDHLTRDLRFAIRQLRKNPGFTAVATMTLALGLSAAVAIYAYVDAALIQPLPYRDPKRLVSVMERSSLIPRTNISFQDYLDWKRMNVVFQSLDAYRNGAFLIDGAAGAEPIAAAQVSDGILRTLGVRPVLGRDFQAGEDQTEPRSVILTHGTWLNRFGGRQDVIGQKMILNGAPFEIIGVLPRGFQFAPLGGAAIWVTIDRNANCHKRRSCHNLYGVARLKDGVSVEAALDNASVIAAELEKQYPDSNRGQGASIVPLVEIVVGQIRPVLLTLLGGAGLLLAIACANVVSLLLVRAENRRRELAIRGALGASLQRLLGQFATEGMLLMAVGAACGLMLAAWSIPVLGKLVPADMQARMPFLNGLELNTRVIWFGVALSLGAATLFSLIPAIHFLLSDTKDGLVEGSRGSAGLAWRRLGTKLVVIEFVGVMVLLFGAGLLSKSLYQLLHVELGFAPDHLATVTVALPGTHLSDPDAVLKGRQIVERLEALPGVKGASLAGTPPVRYNGNTNWIRIVGKPWNGEHNDVNHRPVSSKHLQLIGAKLARGRFLTEADGPGKPLVTVINQTMARKFFPNEDPVGKQIGDLKLTPSSLTEIVGVVEDIREGGLDSEIWPATYVPFNQDADSYFTAIVRTEGDPAQVVPLLARTVKEIDRGIAAMDEETFPDRIARSPVAYLHRSVAWLVGGFAGIAFLLGVVGLYGVVAYSVGQRTREIGVRMALGADPLLVWKLILRESAGLVALASVLGVLGSFAVSVVLRKRFFGIEGFSVEPLLAAAVVLALAAFAASHFPARRAASVNPVEALRAE